MFRPAWRGFYVAILLFVLADLSALGRERVVWRYNPPTRTDGRIDALRAPTPTTAGTYALHVRSSTGEPLRARIEWQIPRGLEAQGVLVEDVYIPASGELVRHLTVRVRASGNYAIVALVRPMDALTSPEPYARFLRVRDGSVIDSALPLPLDPDYIPPIQADRVVRDDPAIAPDQTQYSGRLTYHDDTTGVQEPIREATIKLEERVLDGGFVVIATRDTTQTDRDGRFAFPPVASLTQNGAPRLYRVRAIMQNDTVVLTDQLRQQYERVTAWEAAPVGRAVEDALRWEIGEGGHMVGFLFNAVLDIRDSMRDRVGFTRKQVRIEFPAAEGASFYSVLARAGTVREEVIKIAFEHRGERTAVFHEYGHAIMTAAYGYRYNAIPFGSHEGPHTFHTISDEQFAMSEGWAEFVEALVDDDALNVRSFSNVDRPNIEENQWWTGRAQGNGTNTRGEVVEGAVASILWDISDGPQSHDLSPDEDDDGLANEFPRLWTIFIEDRPQSVVDVREGWIDRSFPRLEKLRAIFNANGIPSPSGPTDVNQDGRTDIRDLVIVARSFGLDGPFAQPSPDVNRDGRVDILDLVRVARALVKDAALAAPAQPIASDGRAPFLRLVQADERGYTASIRSQPDISALTMRVRALGSEGDVPVRITLKEPSRAIWTSQRGDRFLLVRLGRSPIESGDVTLRIQPEAVRLPGDLRLVLSEVEVVDARMTRSRLPDQVLVAPPLGGEGPSVRLLPNFPNPFNPDTWIPFRLQAPATVTVSIQDVVGRTVRRWELGRLDAGEYSTVGRALHWDGRNERGERASSGTYWIVLQADDARAVRKIALVK